MVENLCVYVQYRFFCVRHIVLCACVCEQKLTAIVSLDRLQCFVLPLNFTFVKPLREFYELVKNIAVCLWKSSLMYSIVYYLLQLWFSEHHLKST